MPRVVPAGTSLPLLQLPDSNTRGSWNEEIHRIKQLHAAAVRVQAAARARSVRSRSLAHITQLADSAVRGTATLASNLSTNVQHGASSVQQRMQSCAAGQSVRSTMKAIRDVMRTVDAKLEEYEDEADEQLKQVAKLDMFAPCLLQVASLLAHCTAHIARHSLLAHPHPHPACQLHDKAVRKTIKMVLAKLEKGVEEAIKPAYMPRHIKRFNEFIFRGNEA